MLGVEQFAQFSVEGQKIYGMLHVPEGSPPPSGWPSLVMLHGFTGNRIEGHRNFVLLARGLAARGVACLRFDFRGSGESQGDFSEMTVSREVQDTEAAFEYLRRQPGLDPERVMLLGFSMGAIVATLAARTVRPHRLALWGPALPELWLSYLPGGVLPATVVDHGGWPLGRAFLQEVIRLKPLEAAREWGGVAHVFHGDADATCPPEWGVRYAQAMNCDVTAIPGAGHTFDSLDQVDMLHQATIHFLTGS